MENSKEEKKQAFMKKAENNKANFELHLKLIAENLENLNGLHKSSIDYFAQKGKACGSFLLSLMDYAEKYHEIKSQQSK